MSLLITPDKIIRAQYYTVTYVVYSRTLRYDGAPWRIDIYKEKHREGSDVILKQPWDIYPELLGYTFQDGWINKTTGENSVLTITDLNQDTIIEGRLQYIRPNLLRNTKYLDEPDVVFRTRTEKNIAIDNNSILFKPNGIGSSKSAQIQFKAKLITSVSQNDVYLLSFLAQTINATPDNVINVTSLAPSYPDDNFTFSSSSIIAEAYIDGVPFIPNNRTIRIPSDNNVHLVEIHLRYVLQTPIDYPSTSFTCLTEFIPSTNATVLKTWLPKLENVTNLPLIERRATAWVKHIDDIN
jgi:hypothetical protein